MTCEKLTPPAVSDPVHIAASLTGWPNLLQLSAATFLVPAFMCILQLRVIGIIVYGGNAVCSVYAHRPDRTATDTWTDTLDLIMVAVWVMYNLVLVVETGLDHLNVKLAAVFAFVVLIAKIVTRFLVYRSLRRYVVHTIMHVCGSAGSMCLLLTSK